METELPQPSAELVLLRVFLEAHLDGLPPKEAARFIRRVDQQMELRRALGSVATIRPRSEETTLAAARRAAINWWVGAKAAWSVRVN